MQPKRPGRNFRVTAVAIGAELEQAFSEHAIDLVVLDLRLSRLHGAEVYDRSIDVQVLRLRRKIEPDPARPQYIRTERGVGYLFSVSVEVLN